MPRTDQPLRRFLARFCLVLAAGVAVTLLVAFGSVYLSPTHLVYTLPHERVSPSDTRYDFTWATAYAPPGWTGEPTQREAIEIHGVEYLTALFVDHPISGTAARKSSGWPLHCFYGYSWRSGNNEIRHAGIFESRQPSGSHLRVPMRIHAGAAMANTAFFAAALVLVAATIRSTRRWLRTRRGRCPQCGYPRGTSDNCSECGAILTRAQRSAGA